MPAPAGVKSAALWGTRERLHQMFGGAMKQIRAEKRDFVFRYRSPMHWIEVFRTYYGPLHKAFAALDAEKQSAFQNEILALLEKGNRSNDRTLAIPSEYLEVVMVKR
jgi:hypothetical protein